MLSIYNKLLSLANKDPNFEIIKHKKNYSISDLLNEIRSISKSLKYIQDNFIALYLSDPFDFIIVYIACIKENKVPLLFNNKWSNRDLDLTINKYKVQSIITDWKYKNYK